MWSNIKSLWKYLLITTKRRAKNYDLNIWLWEEYAMLRASPRDTHQKCTLLPYMARRSAPIDSTDFIILIVCLTFTTIIMHSNRLFKLFAMYFGIWSMLLICQIWRERGSLIFVVSAYVWRANCIWSGSIIDGVNRYDRVFGLVLWKTFRNEIFLFIKRNI